MRLYPGRLFRPSITDAKKGQAMMETIFMIPFLVVMIFFMYQAYTVVNKVDVIQRYLKVKVIGRLLNRHTVTVEDPTAPQGDAKTPPPDGSYFYVLDDYDAGQKMMNFGLDDVTVGMLMAFDTSGKRGDLATRLKKAMAGTQAMGLCIGGDGIINGQVDTAVFGIQPGETCTKK